MPRTYPQEYFENKEEQARISLALLQAMPEGVFYHNVIVVLADLLQRMVAGAYEDEVFTKSHKSQLTQDAADGANAPHPGWLGNINGLGADPDVP